jgi:hypothetical protein
MLSGLIGGCLAGWYAWRRRRQGVHEDMPETGI